MAGGPLAVIGRDHATVSAPGGESSRGQQQPVMQIHPAGRAGQGRVPKYFCAALNIFMWKDCVIVAWVVGVILRPDCS